MLRGMTTASETTAAPAPPDAAAVTSNPDPGTTAAHLPEPPAAAPVEPTAAPTADPEPAADAEPELTAADLPALPDGTTADDDTKWTHPEGWKYDWLEYRGDNLAVRIPNKSALHALSNLRYSTPEFQHKLFQKYLANHISPESYERVMARMVDPDDEGYADVSVESDPIGEIMNELSERGRARVDAEIKALNEAQS